MDYYHNGAGLNEGEYSDYIDFIQSSVDRSSTEKALNYSRTYFKGTNLMQDYLYLNENAELGSRQFDPRYELRMRVHY